MTVNYELLSDTYRFLLFGIDISQDRSAVMVMYNRQRCGSALVSMRVRIQGVKPVRILADPDPLVDFWQFFYYKSIPVHCLFIL